MVVAHGAFAATNDGFIDNFLVNVSKYLSAAISNDGGGGGGGGGASRRLPPVLPLSERSREI